MGTTCSMLGPGGAGGVETESAKLCSMPAPIQRVRASRTRRPKAPRQLGWFFRRDRLRDLGRGARRMAGWGTEIGRLAAAARRAVRTDEAASVRSSIAVVATTGLVGPVSRPFRYSWMMPMEDSSSTAGSARTASTSASTPTMVTPEVVIPLRFGCPTKQIQPCVRLRCCGSSKTETAALVEH